jgi:hypothetical protein
MNYGQLLRCVPCTRISYCRKEVSGLITDTTHKLMMLITFGRALIFWVFSVPLQRKNLLWVVISFEHHRNWLLFVYITRRKENPLQPFLNSKILKSSGTMQLRVHLKFIDQLNKAGKMEPSSCILFPLDINSTSLHISYVICEAIAYLRFRNLDQSLWNQVTTMTPP